jgi:hypothetical protein
VVQEVNRKPVTSVQQFRNAVQQAGSQRCCCWSTVAATVRMWW